MRGALSNLGASAAMANGIPATTMGEPGHCAYAVKIDDTTWQPSYSLSWKRGMHTSFHEGSWPGLMITEACFRDPRRVQKAGDLVDTSFRGAGAMLPIATLLVLAFGIGAICDELGTGPFIAAQVTPYLTPLLVAPLVFLVSGAMSIPRRWAVHLPEWVFQDQVATAFGALVVRSALVLVLKYVGGLRR